MISAINPTPANPCRTYIRPQVISPKTYGFRMKNGVLTRFIMNTPVIVTDKPAKTMMAWYILFSIGYFANFRGAGAFLPVARSQRLLASSMSIESGQMDQKSSQKDAWMMWKTMDAVNTSPAIQ